MPEHTTFKIDLTTSIEQRHEHCAIFIKELGFFIYADSPEQTPTALQEAITTLFKALGNDFTRITAYLDAKGIVYRADEPIPNRPAPPAQFQPGTINDLFKELRDQLEQDDYPFSIDQTTIQRAEVALVQP